MLLKLFFCFSLQINIAFLVKKKPKHIPCANLTSEEYDSYSYVKVTEINIFKMTKIF